MTDNEKEAYLACIAETGLVMMSCDHANISHEQLRHQRKVDSLFVDAEKQAQERHNEKVKLAFLHRGVNGWEEPITSRNKDGSVEVVGYKQKFSARILEVYAKSRMQEFRDRAPEVNVGTAGVLVVNGMAKSKDEWLEKYGGVDEEPEEDGER